MKIYFPNLNEIFALYTCVPSNSGQSGQQSILYNSEENNNNNNVTKSNINIRSSSDKGMCSVDHFEEKSGQKVVKSGQENVGECLKNFGVGGGSQHSNAIGAPCAASDARHALNLERIALWDIPEFLDRHGLESLGLVDLPDGSFYLETRKRETDNE